MRKVLPKYHQHSNFPTRGDQTLDQCNSQLKDSYKPPPHPAFGTADHTSILLLPSYRQDQAVFQAVQRWSEETIVTLQDCFVTTDWQMFCDAADGDIDEYTDSVSAYISKCMDDVAPSVNVKTFPNQKPWVNGDVRDKLRARSSAFSSGDLENFRKSRYDLGKATRSRVPTSTL